MLVQQKVIRLAIVDLNQDLSDKRADNKTVVMYSHILF